MVGRQTAYLIVKMTDRCWLPVWRGEA